ncbi:unnamed protein product [Rotaria socialis]|uniref:Uncharacterized protein n=1 Tax=Rotaria socialis TaxID=392032 RepID=A0A817UFP2_9BILA|nr:unnamed protein product [Rotaria socialis]CAF4514732.1 unnamed protein product [Rotaria socialis]
MTTKTNPKSFYSSMYANDDQLFANEQIQRYDADTIKNRYGDNWRNYASNVREIKQADGSIVREYIIEDPSLLKEIKPSLDSASSSSSSTSAGSDDEQQSSKHKFAQIKAKFEKKSLTNVMASPSSSSTLTSSNPTTRRNSDKQINDLYPKKRQGSTDSSSTNRTVNDIAGGPRIPSNLSQNTSNSQHSQSTSNSSFRRLNSAEEADEEVQRIHRQVQDFRQHQDTLTPISSIDENKQQSNVQYEVLDENGNPISIDGVTDLIKMSGVTAREVQQQDGSFIREYVIDDPDILSKFHKQQSPMVSQQQSFNNNIPPPPPRIPLKQSMLFHQGPSSNDQHPPINIENIHVLEPQRRYEYTTTSGKRIEFMITHSESGNQMINDSDIRELSSAINNHHIPSSSSSSISNPTQQQQQQQTYNLPKQWHPAVDLTIRNGRTRQRTGSDNQAMPNNYNVNFQQMQQMPSDLTRSASYGALNQGAYQQSFAPVFTEPIIDWTALRQQDPQGQIDPQVIQQFIAQKHQNGSFQTSAQFLPEQKQQPMTRSIHSPSRYNASAAPTFYQHQQQQMSYPYQGQQQHGVRITNDANDMHFNQQQLPTMMGYHNTRI